MAYMNLTRFIALGTVIVTVLGACGGGAPGASTPTTPTTPTIPAANISVSFSPSNLSDISTTTSTATIQVLDSNNNVMRNAPVTVQVVDGSAFWNSSANNTGTSGILTGVVSQGGNLSNRDITLLVRSGSITREARLTVSGVSLTASAPSSVNTGSLVTITFNLRKNGQAVGNQLIQVSSSLGHFAQTGQMNSAGNYTVAYTANFAGADVITASAGGATFTTTINVATVAIPTPTPDPTTSSIGIQANPATITAGSPSSQIEATVIGAGNVNIRNARVRFRIADPNSIGGSLNSTTTVTTLDVYTDANGKASATYYAGNKSGPTDGIAICAQFLNPPDGSPTADNPYPGVTAGNVWNPAGPAVFCNRASEAGVPLTVSTVPVSITLGTDNTISSGQGGLTYIKRYIATVTNSSGGGQSGAVVSGFLDVFRYRKGFMGWNLAGNPNVWSVADFISCINEDRNRNGVLDTGEDSTDTALFPDTAGWGGNGNGELDPRIPVAVRLLNNGVTNASGFVTIEIEYPENYALWAEVRLTVATVVGGTEGRTSVNLILPELASDYTDQGVPPAGVSSPFGINTTTCRAP